MRTRDTSGTSGWVLFASLVVITAMSNAGSDDHAQRLQLPTDGWRLVTDGVMGGVSRGTMTTEEIGGRTCTALRGRVSTENNGGFIQIALDLEGPLRTAEEYDGIQLDVLGNGETYNVHLRTSDLWLPWQSYRASFETSAEWSTLYLPFSSFEPYRTGARLRLERLRRIGVVAIGREFDADVCLSGVALYRRGQ